MTDSKSFLFEPESTTFHFASNPDINFTKRILGPKKFKLKCPLLSHRRQWLGFYFGKFIPVFVFAEAPQGRRCNGIKLIQAKLGFGIFKIAVIVNCGNYYNRRNIL